MDHRFLALVLHVRIEFHVTYEPVLIDGLVIDGYTADLLDCLALRIQETTGEPKELL